MLQNNKKETLKNGKKNKKCNWNNNISNGIAFFIDIYHINYFSGGKSNMTFEKIAARTILYSSIFVILFTSLFYLLVFYFYQLLVLLLCLKNER